MTDWSIQLTEDTLRRRHPSFPTLAERIAAYESFYLSSGTKKASSHEETSPKQSFPDGASLDIRRTQSPFSTLLYLYDTAGNEYTFSRLGMRHVKRSLPWQGHYHTHDYIEILHVLKGSFSQILLGECHTFSAGEFVITDKNLRHADVFEGAQDSAVLFLSLQSDYLDHLLSSHDSQDDLQRFFFHALQKQRKEQSYIHLQPAGNFQPSGDFQPARNHQAVREYPLSLPASKSAADSSMADSFVADGSAVGSSMAGGSALQLSRLLETLLEEDYFPAPGSGEIIRGSLIRLLSLLCSQYTMKLHSSDQESRERAFLYELERYLRLHFATVTASELEDVFHYHRNFYNLLLRKYRGVSFREYLQDIRMRHAAELLKNTRLPVREITLAAGYRNSSHFYHLFERHFGVSPALYRENQ